MHPFARVLVLAALALLHVASPGLQARSAARRGPGSYTLFESGPVRPLALTPDGRTLLACNIPDNRLEIFRVTGAGLAHLGAVPVGLEPVAVAARSDTEAWVVNHLSDSVSVVHLPTRRVTRTLLTGDEPRDIVFAGRGRRRAFVTTAHRGQNVPYDPQLTTPGVGRADVWVFDAAAPGVATLGGAPLAVLTLFTDTPRALAATPDGRRVYAAGFHTGSRTTTVFEGLVPDAAAAPENLALPEPRTNYAGIVQPQTGLIVKFDGEHWRDEDGRIWDSRVKFDLPDKDVFMIDADAPTPALVPGADGAFAGVGTILYNMAVNPRSGRVYVSNTEARNHVRFEGAGGFLAGLGKHSVRGHLHESRITVLGGEPRVKPIHLNKHIDYSTCCAPISSDENTRSVATPLDLAVSGDGKTLYVAAFGTSEVAVYDTKALEDDTFAPDVANQIPVSGGGPGGLALDEKRGRLYVLTRFDNAVSVVDTSSKTEIAHLPLYNPEPASVRAGRRFLYDASHTSSHGDSSCSSCHVFGDFDSLAWDLGDPDGDEIANAPDPGLAHPDPRVSSIFTLKPEFAGVSRHFRPMKGPMTTQSLRGMANHGPMHWRGDRLNNGEASVQPDGGIFDEETAFRKFNPAFVGLNGRHEPLADAEMQAFTDFILQVTYPPNPVRALDDRLTPDQQAGRDFYFAPLPSDTFFNCNGCHVLDPAGNAQFPEVAKPGFFGSDGRFSFENEPQIFKIPHLRNLYQKVGMFGMAANSFFLPGAATGESNGHLGAQVRGFGFLHDGSVDTLNRFHSATLFVQRTGPAPTVPLPNLGGFPLDPSGVLQRRQVEQFMLAFDSNLKPVVGQQVTLDGLNASATWPRLALLLARADAGDGQVVARRGKHGYLYVGGGKFRQDRAGAPLVPELALRILSLLPFQETTFTCVPPGSGLRIALDRDEDGVLDGDE